MADKFNEDLFEDVPYEDSLFEDKPYDEGLFEDQGQSLDTPDMEQVIGEIAPTALGVGVGEAAKTGLDVVRESGPQFAERQAFRSIGGFDTPEGRKFIKEQLKTLGLPETAISPESIGRMLLEEKELGKLGFKGVGEQFESIDQKLLQSIEDKKNILSQIQGKKDIAELQKRTQQSLGTLDPKLSEIDRQLAGFVSKEAQQIAPPPIEPDMNVYSGARELDLDAPPVEPPVAPKNLRSAVDIEDLKTQLQALQKYDASRGEAAKDIFQKAQAKAAREMVEELAAQAGLGDEFQAAKERTGKLGITRDVLLGKTLKEGKTPGLDLPTTIGLAEGKPEIPLARAALKKGQGALAVGTDFLSKALDTKVGKGITKSLPFVGGLMGFSAAKAEGLPTEQAAGKALVEELDVVPGGVEEAGFPRGSVERNIEMGQRPSQEEIKALLKQQEEAFKEHRKPKDIIPVQTFTTQASKNTTSSKEIQDMLNNPVFSSFQNTLDKAAQAQGTEREQIMYGLRQQPAFRKLMNK